MGDLTVAYFPKSFSKKFCIKVLEKGFEKFFDTNDEVYTKVIYAFSKRDKVVLFANMLQKMSLQTYVNLNDWQKIDLKQLKEKGEWLRQISQ